MTRTMVIDHYWLPGGEHASRTAMGDDRTDRQDGVLINLNHEDYHTRITEEED